uniref:NifB/NifX family molybdenum-iron cluster-binding protein n=1 Tax=Candidatus Desulfatibia profunda TaxID=2841695 RepID=A0A8J6NQL4_9BACT|nr:NifB/NifX family molybdenum-iron cluster-binding protein [Candidatus Desulfatibia profunda]
MKVALTVWENRISPVFDTAKMLLLAEIKDKKVISKRHEPFDPELFSRLVNRLTELDITVLICGAISKVPANIIEASRIKLIPFISGKADDVLECYAQGIQIIPAFLMPGCDRKHRRHSIKK